MAVVSVESELRIPGISLLALSSLVCVCGCVVLRCSYKLGLSAERGVLEAAAI
jgi:hypothetical protein